MFSFWSQTRGGQDVSGFPTPHLEKLTATHANDKLPARDKPRIEKAIGHYQQWIKDLDAVTGKTPKERLDKLVALLNEYRFQVDVELIFDSKDNFLYRQKGQLKLDNSIIEEFLPRLIHPSILPEIAGFDVTAGPARCFSALYFESSLDVPQFGGGMTIRTKAQDFAISKKLYLKAAHAPDFSDAVTKDTFIAYVVSECKTNLDKTMFQEACATAHDVKSAVSGARYYLLCEWLDMTPVSTVATDVDEVIILRKSKRLGSNVRGKFGSLEGRRDNRNRYIKHLKDNPLRVEMVQRFLSHVRGLLQSEAPVERDVLSKGFF
jgi:hypothetical protein